MNAEIETATTTTATAVDHRAALAAEVTRVMALQAEHRAVVARAGAVADEVHFLAGDVAQYGAWCTKTAEREKLFAQGEALEREIAAAGDGMLPILLVVCQSRLADQRDIEQSRLAAAGLGGRADAMRLLWDSGEFRQAHMVVSELQKFPHTMVARLSASEARTVLDAARLVLDGKSPLPVLRSPWA